VAQATSTLTDLLESTQYFHQLLRQVVDSELLTTAQAEQAVLVVVVLGQMLVEQQVHREKEMQAEQDLTQPVLDTMAEVEVEQQQQAQQAHLMAQAVAVRRLQYLAHQ
jgi:hypothetical protein